MNFAGIDVHLRSYTAAFISEELDILELADTQDEGLFQLIETYRPVVVAIDAPYGPNVGLMDQVDYRRKLNPSLKGHYNKKVAEYELTRRGFALYNTPQDLGDVTGWKAWMGAGMQLFAALAARGYGHLSEKNVQDLTKGTAEVFPHASFAVLAGSILPKKSTSHGLAARYNILRELGFCGLAKVDGANSKKADGLDALIAAFTAKRISDGEATFLGDIAEGQIALPVSSLKEHYCKLKNHSIEQS